MADTLLADAQDLENKAAAFQAADQASVAAAAQADALKSARDQAHVDLQMAIAKVVSDAQGLDPAVQSAAAVVPASPAPAAS